jgi:14-3-3 protein epsilon
MCVCRVRFGLVSDCLSDYRKGDYYRYLAEFSSDSTRQKPANSSLDAYKLAYKLALSTLEPTHPTRLGLALNFSVYYRDVLNSPERACHLAKHAFDEAVAVLDQMPEATYRDSLLILQLLRDDLMLWFKEIQERGKRVAMTS